MDISAQNVQNCTQHIGTKTSPRLYVKQTARTKYAYALILLLNIIMFASRILLKNIYIILWTYKPKMCKIVHSTWGPRPQITCKTNGTNKISTCSNSIIEYHNIRVTYTSQKYVYYFMDIPAQNVQNCTQHMGTKTLDYM